MSNKAHLKLRECAGKLPVANPWTNRSLGHLLSVLSVEICQIMKSYIWELSSFLTFLTYLVDNMLGLQLVFQESYYRFGKPHKGLCTMWLTWLEPSGKHGSQLGIITPAVGIRHLQFLRRPTAANVCFSSPHQSAGLLSSVLHSTLLFLVLALLTLILFLLLANVPLSDLPLSNLPLSTHLYQLISPRLSLPTSLYQTYLCQTCLSQTQLIPIKLISTNSSISNLSVPNLLSVPSLSLDWPSVGADAWARWFSLLSRWAGAALRASLDWFAVVALCLGALAPDRPYRSAGKKCL